MKKRPLGNSGISVSPIALGGNVFGWTIDEKASFPILDAFLDRGFDLIDTANMYSTWVPGNQGGESETVIGNWLHARGHRDKVILATKVGMPMGDGSQGLRKEYIIAQAEESLRRLRTDYIDLYQSHQDDASTPIEETLEAYSELIASGKVRAIGASNFTAERLRESLSVSQNRALASYVSLQPQYNLMEREDYETNLEPLVLEKNLAVIPYYSLASGFLTGKYRSRDDLKKSARGGSVEGYLNGNGPAVLQALDHVAEEQSAPLAAVALAWLIARKSITAPIVSATSVAQLEESLQAASLTLHQEQIDRIEQASRPGVAK